MEWSLITAWVVLSGAVLMMLLLQELAMVGGDDVLATDGLQKDTQGLLSFKQIIEKDPFGLLEGWGASASNSCEWRGVSCVNGRVAAVDLSNGGLLAPLPVSALAPLDQLRELRLQGNVFYGYGSEQVVDAACNTLTVLDLSSNNLTGGFSASANVVCTTLTHLNLSHNAFHGSLSSFGLVGADQSSLATLDLSYNNFSGSFPSHVFSKCGSLAWLDLSHNSLMGGIPEGVSVCASLLHLDLSYNLLNSTLPEDIISPISSTSLNASTSLTYLNLSCNRLTGSLPDTLHSPVLLSLDLSANFFIGSIPPSLSSSTALQFLNLSFNSLYDPLPPSLSSLTNLRGLYLNDNNFTGSIPSEFGSTLTALEELDLSANRLVGTIPASFSNLSVLHYLNLGTNFISGEFPKNVVCAMPALRTLIVSFNNLTGALPPDGLADCKLLSKLDLSANGLTGGVPDSFCGPQLQQMLLQDNDLVGAIPEALGNCTSLIILDLSCNLLSGPLPPSLAGLPLLQELMMWGNSLKGPISPSFGAAFYLKKLILNINFLSGSIPPALGNCSNLEWLSLSSNLLSGIIPPELGSMTKIGILQLANNTLTGPIPASLGNCNKLIWLDLNNNLLEGTIPVELTKQAGKVTRGTLNQATEYGFIKNLDRQCKGLGGLLEYSGIRDETLFQLNSVKQACNVTLLYHGTDPYYFPNTRGSLEYIDLGYNRLIGTIPAEFGLLRYLLVLSLSHNALTGPIPDSLSNLALLTILYVDHNMLQGPIPPSLAGLGLVNQLDFSNNNLSGPIPQTGTMSTMPASVFANNPGLCGAPLQPCGYTSTSGSSDSSLLSRHRSSGGWSVVAITMSSVGAFSVVAACACAMAACFVVKKHKMKQNVRDGYMDNLPSGSDSNSWNINGAGEPLSINVATFEKPLRKLTFAHLLEATNGFSAKAVIGRGGFGEVYKATLEGGVVVAIKKLVHAIASQGDREFMAEMETLGKIKHRNLVPLLGYCKVGQERLLVYEYMEGGSLDKTLHGDCILDSDESDGSGGETQWRASLSWEMRKRIALGTARGLCFLHHSCIPHIIHRDLKSSNVLLDDTLEARVSDFGMARLMSAAETHLSVSSLVGTPGYVPPEYCHSFRCTTKGDVYSFGVVLLELITGKRPTWSSSSKGEKSKHVSAYPSPILSESDGGSTSTTSGTSVTPNSGTPIREALGEDEDSACGVDLVGWVKKQLKAGKPSIEILDQTALLINRGGAIIPPNRIVVEKEMLRYLEIACWCVEQSPHKRPNMLEVMSLFRALNQDQELDSL